MIEFAKDYFFPHGVARVVRRQEDRRDMRPTGPASNTFFVATLDLISHGRAETAVGRVS
jgi:hypothetical protein